MNVRDALLQHFALMYRTARANLEGVTFEGSLVQPSPGGNCANWILGHLVRVQNTVMRALGEAPVWESDQLDRAGWEPITDPSAAIQWDTMRERFLGSAERCLAALTGITDESLAEDGLTHPFGGTCDRAELLSLLAFHQTYHVGQLALSRRLAGLPGAVRGPGQPPAD